MPVPVITPGGPLAKLGKSATNFTSDIDVVWSANGGTLSNILARSVTWTAPNSTGNWNLFATVGPDQDFVLIVVESVIPNYWDYQNPIEAIKKKLQFEPIAGPTQNRSFGSPASQHRWELGSDDNSREQYLEMKAFWDWHDPGKQFLMWDPQAEETRRYETDSNWSGLYKVGESYSWKFRIKEVWPYAIIP